MKKKIQSPFWIMVYKEISDQVRSWKFIILGIIMILTCMGALYTSLTSLAVHGVDPNDPNGSFLFLKLFTLSEGTLPPFHVFITFLGPLLGISLGFDAVNSELNNRTLSRIIAQPIHRDYIINAKCTASLIVIGSLLLALTLLVIGFGLIIIGIPPSPGEFMRIIAFWLLSVLYIAFWLNLSILFSIKFRQAATSALTSIAVWLFFTVFYPMIIKVIATALVPAPRMAAPGKYIHKKELAVQLFQITPSQLYSDATSTLLLPSVRSLGPLSMAQTYGAIPSPLPLGQSLLIVWPQLTGLIAVTIVCFAVSYVLFMKKEIRTR
ncbi:MAG TPA: ABC transporter permease subunit [Chitinophagaceae bacterium]|nr:ABC transporter permease subunit [Chitinophagaceae bacterium]